MNSLLEKHAFNAGIRLDAFGCPVVDKSDMLQDFVQQVFIDLMLDLQPKTAAILAVAIEKYGLVKK